METQVFLPKNPAVRGIVELYLLANSAEPFELMTIPNGRVDASIILEGQLEWLFKSKGGYEPLAPATFYPLTRDLGKVRSRGRLSCIGIKFFPHVLVSAAFEKKTVREPMAFTEIFDKDDVDHVINVLKKGKDDQLVDILDNFCRQFFLQASDHWIQEIITAIECEKFDRPKIGEIAESMGISIKTVERRFQKVMGISPKLFSNIVRHHQAIRKIRRRGPTIASGDLAEALGSGYYDQPHFVRSCKKLTGLAPRKLFSQLPNQVTDLVLI